MKKLKGHVYIIPIPQVDSTSTKLSSSDYKIRKFISGLLGLSQMPEKWLPVCACDDNDHPQEEISFDLPGSIDSNGERRENENRTSSDWSERGYFLDGSPGIIPFPEYLPAVLFEGRQEDDVVMFIYGDIEVSLTLKQLPYRYGRFGKFEQVFAKMIESTIRETDDGEDEKGEDDRAEEEPCFSTYGEQKSEMLTATKVFLGILGGLVLVGTGIAIGVSSVKGNA
jgi:hypothetical protein